MRIHIEDDFDLYKIAYSGQCFRVKQLDDNSYSFVTGKSRMIMTSLGNDDFEISCTEDEWKGVWHDYFDMDTNYRQIRESIPDSDPYMKHASDIGAGIRILRQNKFEMLLSFITSQRKSIPAIKTSVERMCDLYGHDGFFPEPSAMLNATFEELSGCGLGYRVPYIQNAVSRVALKEVDLNALDKLSDEELFEELKTFNGVGDKVANCVALFAYHRTALAPVDTWINKVINTEYEGINPFPKYGNVGGIMQQYMFYAAQHMHKVSLEK